MLTLTPIPPTTIEELDKAVWSLKGKADAWLKVSTAERISLLEDSIREFGRLMETWVERSLIAKQDTEDPYSRGMEWIGGPVAALRYCRGLIRSLKDIESRGTPTITGPVLTKPDGRVVAQIYPSSLYERVITAGVSAEVWMEKGVSAADLPGLQAVAYHAADQKGKVALVLGAGNVAAIPLLDSLFKMFVENQVVILKMNPVNEYLGPMIEMAFKGLISRDTLRVVYGGASQGTFLSNHPAIDEIHLTGSDKTYEAIVFGGGEEGARRKREHQPLVSKRFTAELGSVGPAIIVPGPWTAKEMHYQAEQVSSHLCDNASFSCSRTRVILTHAGWDLHDAFISEVRKVLGGIPSRHAYYPGSTELYAKFQAAHPEGEKFGEEMGNRLPWMFIPGLDPGEENEICFQTESFCPVMAETALEAGSVVDFIQKAVDFANQRLWGTLSASIIVHPAVLKDARIANALEEAIANLRYGAVVLNGIGGMAWAMASPPWGSYPGNDMYDIQSGMGFANNVFMFNRIEKVVVRAPFMMWPEPIWFNSRGKTFSRVTRKVAAYDLQPSLWKLPGIVLEAIRD